MNKILRLYLKLHSITVPLLLSLVILHTFLLAYSSSGGGVIVKVNLYNEMYVELIIIPLMIGLSLLGEYYRLKDQPLLVT